MTILTNEQTTYLHFILNKFNICQMSMPEKCDVCQILTKFLRITVDYSLFINAYSVVLNFASFLEKTNP